MTDSWALGAATNNQAATENEWDEPVDGDWDNSYVNGDASSTLDLSRAFDATHASAVFDADPTNSRSTPKPSPKGGYTSASSARSGGCSATYSAHSDANGESIEATPSRRTPRWWEDEAGVPPWEIQCQTRKLALPRRNVVVPALRPPRTPRSAKERVGISRPPEDDLFAMWSSAARSDTPQSVWNGQRGPAAPASIRKSKQARLHHTAHTPRCVPDHVPTVRSTLIGRLSQTRSPAPQSPARKLPRELAAKGVRPALYEEPHTPPPAHLDGVWISRRDGETRGYIESTRLLWAEDGSTSRLSFYGLAGNIVNVVVDGEAHSAVLSADRRLLRWGDGDVWVREDDEMEDLRPINHSTGDGKDVPWQGWSTSRPQSRSTPRSLLPI
eukprot:TRINITY_DN45328_c0_g1_i1.p1 TRINITY_DN45328_c0_g1~~TRINITY_DN45328_c0_g1_i1.p1  ORF type:complete len:385 (+),score=49.76 TRINITY_DN45328_c0_g1_i1:187-1341(+)